MISTTQTQRLTFTQNPEVQHPQKMETSQLSMPIKGILKHSIRLPLDNSDMATKRLEDYRLTKLTNLFFKLFKYIYSDNCKFYDLPEEDKLILIRAVKEKDLASIEFLLRNGINLNLQDSSGNTAVHTAVLEKNHAVIDLLAIYGANLNIKEKRLGMTALDIAVYNGDLVAIDCLLHHKAKVNDQKIRTLIGKYRNIPDTLKQLLEKFGISEDSLPVAKPHIRRKPPC